MFEAMFEATSSDTAQAEGDAPEEAASALMPSQLPEDAEPPRRSNIVGLDGKAFAPPNGPQVSATLVGEMERLLEAAKCGDIVGMAGAFIHSDRLVSYSFAGAVGGFGIIGGLECLKERLVRHALTAD